MSYCYDYPRPAVSVDVVLLCRNPNPKILLIQRLHEPFADSWALPGGFLELEETLEQAAVREVQEETGIVISNPTQVMAFSQVDRDPRGRVISFLFYTAFETLPVATAADDAKAVQWFDLQQLPDLAFDHAAMIKKTNAMLRDSLKS